MNILGTRTLSAILLLLSVTIFAADTPKFEWSKLTEVPAPAGKSKQFGLANPFTGVSNDVLLVGGGANFPNKSVVDGGKKVYHQDLFVLTKSEDGTSSWKTGFKLPNPVAYGVSIPYKNGVLCVGGKNSDGLVSDIFLMTWNPKNETVEFDTNFPKLPKANHVMGAVVLNDTLYVMGGGTADGASNETYGLKLGDKDQNWVKLASIPGTGRLQPAVAVQSNGTSSQIYLFGGFDNNDPKAGPNVNVDGFVFSAPKELVEGAGSWKEIAHTKVDGKDLTLAASFAVPYGAHHIICIGGVNKEIFTKAIERENLMKVAKKSGNIVELAKLKAEWTAYMSQQPSAFNFNRNVMAYHTVTNTWNKLQDYQFDGPAGAPLVKWGDDIVVVNGETMPGVRTPRIAIGKMKNEASFGTINYIVLITYLVAMLGVGYFFMKRENGTEDFFKGGGRVPWWAAGVSIFATMLSSISFMAIPGMTYAGTWGIFLLAITITLSQPVVIKYYLPFFRRLNVTTAYEYLEARFNIQCRTLASLVFILFMVVRIGIVSYLPALALQAVTGIDIVACIFGIGIITIIYCTMGGVEAVIWGDFIQGIVLIVGAIIAFLYIASGVDGGIGGIIDVGMSQAKFEIIDTALSINKPTIWILLVGGFLSNLFTYTSDQSVIQRYITVKDEKSAIKSIWVNAIACIPVSILFYAIGTGLYAYYQTSPELLNVAMSKGDQIFPFFIMQKLPVGLAGLLIAAVFSATMSTLSSNINSAATAVTTDFYQRFNKGVSDHQSMRIARFSTVAVGFSGILIAYALYVMKDLPVFEYFNMIVGLLVSGLGVFFVMGIFTKKITGWGAITGFITSSIVLYFLKQSPMHWSGYSIVVLIVCVVVAYIASMILGDKKEIDGLTIYTLRDEMSTEVEVAEIDAKENCAHSIEQEHIKK